MGPTAIRCPLANRRLGASCPSIFHPARANRVSHGRGPCRASCRVPSRSARTTIICQADRRRMIVKRREVPRAQRKKLRYRDEPRDDDLNLDPSAHTFPGRLTTEINSANGPLSLLRLVQSYGPYFSGTQASMALGRLASFATFEGAMLTEEQLTAQSRAARRCVLLLRQRLADCDLLGYARATYALGRLGVYDAELVGGVVSEAADKLNLFSADGLAALLAGLAALGHRPPDNWLDRYALEVYARFSRFNGPELANILYGMARLSYRPSTAWTERCMDCFRAALALPAAPPMAVATVKVAFALALMEVRPSFNWTTALIARARPQLDMLSARELASLLWALSRILHIEPRQPPQVVATPAAPAAPAASAPVAAAAGGTVRKVAAVTASGTAGRGPAPEAPGPGPPPPSAAVGLDRPFLDSWFRCMSRRMKSADAASMVLLLQALAAMQVDRPPSKFVAALLAQLQAALECDPEEEPQTEHDAGEAAEPVALGRPSAGPGPGSGPRIARRSQRPQRRPSGPSQGQGQGSGSGQLPGRLGGTEVVSVLLSLVALRIRPSGDWMEASLEALEPELRGLEPAVLCELAWSLARLQYQPSETWEAAFLARCDAVGAAAFSAQQRGLLAWSCWELRLRRPEAVRGVRRADVRDMVASEVRGSGGPAGVRVADSSSARRAAGGSGGGAGSVGGAAALPRARTGGDGGGDDAAAADEAATEAVAPGSDAGGARVDMKRSLDLQGRVARMLQQG